MSRKLQTIVSIEHLKFRWNDREAIILDIPDLYLGKGESVFIHGPSGCGKSSLISLIAGVVNPSEGTVSVLNQSLGALGGADRDRFRADHVGLIFQMFNLVPYLSVLENVTLPCRFSASRKNRASVSGSTPENEAERLLDSLDLADPMSRDRPVSEFSAGQQQRVAAARALIGSPELIIADEPTSALDADRRHGFIKLLFAECRASQSTLLFVSHDMTLSRHFDRVIPFSDINKVRPQGS
jgi:putative ABC transport system ATP-binding protein